MTTTTNPAHDYALLIRAEILALETLIENWQDVAGYSPDDMPEDIDADTLADIVAALAELGIEWPAGDTDLMADYLNETCLDLTVLRVANRANYEDRTRVEILRTCGGPRCDITRDSNDGTVVEIVAHDGGTSSTLRVNVENVAAQLDELAGCY